MRGLIRTALPVVLVVFALGSVTLAQTPKYGGPINVQTATRVTELHATPEKFVGKTIRVDGLATSVCTDMGCWVAVKDLETDQTVRFQAEHDGSIVFPITLKGKPGSFQGQFVKIGASDGHAHEAAAEHAHAETKAADFGSKYQIKVTGWVSSEPK